MTLHPHNLPSVIVLCTIYIQLHLVMYNVIVLLYIYCSYIKICLMVLECDIIDYNKMNIQ